MLAAFFHARQDPKFANIAVAAATKWLSCPLLHITDETTPALEGCNALRLPWDGKDPMVFRALLLSKIEGQVLSLDTDVVVQWDLCKVFDFPFDVALTRRHKPILDQHGNDLTKTMPYNGGVFWSRDDEFRLAYHKFCDTHKATFGWFIDQVALAQVGPRFNLLTLDCDNFNYTPKSATEDVSQRFAVHYKGERKRWMAIQ